MTIPFMRLDRQFADLREEIMLAIMPVLESGAALQSPPVQALECALSSLVQTRHAAAVSNGTDALALGIMALDLPAGSRIAVTSMSFVASASAILRCGHEPVFVDVDPATMMMDTGATLELVQANAVDAVMVVHLYGQLMDLDVLGAACAERDIPIIEDGAQALGALRHGRPMGRHGRVTCLSFDPTKVIGAYGSGGAVLTDDADIDRKVRLLRYHGHAGNQEYPKLGFNHQIDAIQAAILLAKLPHLDAWADRRRQIAVAYDATLADIGLSPVRRIDNGTHNFHKYVFWASDREEVQTRLSASGVQTKVQYPVPLHRQAMFSQDITLPKAEEAARHILSLPIYAELTDGEVEAVCDALRAAG